MQPATFVDVLHAQQRLRPHLARTPLHSYPALKRDCTAKNCRTARAIPTSIRPTNRC